MVNKKMLAIIGTWILNSLLGLFFVLMGINKFLLAAWEMKFAAWGYPSNFHFIIGFFEIIGGIGLFVPRIRPYCSGLLTLIMLGALITHILFLEKPNIVVTLVFSLILAAITYRNRNMIFAKQEESSQPKRLNSV